MADGGARRAKDLGVEVPGRQASIIRRAVGREVDELAGGRAARM